MEGASGNLQENIYNETAMKTHVSLNTTQNNNKTPHAKQRKVVLAQSDSAETAASTAAGNV